MGPWVIESQENRPYYRVVHATTGEVLDSRLTRNEANMVAAKENHGALLARVKRLEGALAESNAINSGIRKANLSLCVLNAHLREIVGDFIDLYSGPGHLLTTRQQSTLNKARAALAAGDGEGQ